MSLEPIKYGLALHTTSPQLGLTISNFAGESRSQTWDLGRSLSTDLHQILMEFIAPQTWTDLAFIAVAKGPGSFTGTRLGVVTARTLAQQLEIPLFAISTLATVARFQQQKDTSIPEESLIIVQMPAQRSQIFAAIYKTSKSQLITLLPDTALTLEVWQQTLDKCPTPYHLIRAETDLGATSTALLELAYLDWQLGLRPTWSDALPFYGQHPVDNDKNDANIPKIVILN
jgi:tRNA threonylcarbamoyl adenosine modification protein YeaZ